MYIRAGVVPRGLPIIIAGSVRAAELVNWFFVSCENGRMRRVFQGFNVNIIPWLVLACSLVISLLLWRAEEHSIMQKAEARFQEKTRDIESAVALRLHHYQLMLQGCVGLFHASVSVNRNEWKIYAQSVDPHNNYPGIQGIGFARRVSAAEKEAHIRELRAEGFPDYSIWPAGDRAEYFSIIYLEPFSGRNLRAFSYDMFSEPVRRAAMEEARDRGLTIISGKVTLVQETTEDIQPGFLMYVPLYEPNRPLTSVQDRRAALRGFVYSPFRMNDFIKGIITIDHNLSSIAWEVYDGNDVDSDRILYRSLDNAAPSFDGASPVYEKKATLELFGKTWTLYFKTMPSFEASLDRTRLVAIVCFSMLVSFLLFAVTFLVVDRSKALAAELIRRERDQEALCELKTAVEQSADGIAFADLDGQIRFVNEAWARMHGYSVDELIGRNLSMFHTAEQLKTEVPHALELLRATGSSQGDIQHVRKDGSIFPTWMINTVVKFSGQKPSAMIGIARDITERKKAEMELQEKTAMLKEANKELESFNYTVSHDLKSPLLTINGFTAMILKKQGDAFDEDTRSKFNVIRANTQKMGQLIDALLNFSRIGRKAIDATKLNMAAIVSDVWNEGLVNKQERDIALDIKDMPAASGDRALIKQVYINLVGNAVKFTEHCPAARIEAGGYTDGNENVYLISGTTAQALTWRIMKNCSAFFSVFTTCRTMKGRASVWRLFSASSTSTAAGSGLKGKKGRARLFIFHCRVSVPSYEFGV